MRSDDAAIYRDIQKNAEMGIKAIEAVSPKLTDDAFALQLQAGTEVFRNQDKARHEMLEGRAESTAAAVSLI
ncbi:MAG: hypothetical protein ACLVAW_29025 [Eisenbergiella massiliensis]